MKKITLDLNNLAVESFETAAAELGRGTIEAHQPTVRGNQCGSAFDACVTGLCTGKCGETYSPDACPTFYPEYCESADDACASARGCTEIDCV